MNSQEYAYRVVEKAFIYLKLNTYIEIWDSNILIIVNHSLKITRHECCWANEDRVVKHVR